MRAGTIEHKHLENRMREKTPLPEGYERGERFCRVIEQAGEVKAEQKLAINRDLKIVGYFAKDVWGRCVIDVSSKKDSNIGIFDWKTGNIREDSLQLKINACFMSIVHPDVEKFITRYIWLKHDTVTPKDGKYTKEEIPKLWEEVLSIVERMENAWRTEEFSPRPSGLCRNYCDVTDCKFRGK